jgi:hypothetical protein
MKLHIVKKYTILQNQRVCVSIHKRKEPKTENPGGQVGNTKGPNPSQRALLRITLSNKSEIAANYATTSEYDHFEMLLFHINHHAIK